MRPERTAERGLSLIEVLVATAILSLAIIIALTVYDASRNAFAKGENATEQQESVRIAFDRLTSDLRMLGYNVNPDGDPTRPDEQLEGALRHAVILRADFDASDPTAGATPESSLAAGSFPAVSTGNDEIVAYVLAKPDGTGPDTMTFQADVREPARDGVVETVSVGNVVLDPVSPPYTLYRVTLNNDSSTYGAPAFVVRTPVVENVRDLSFTYYSSGGTFEDAGPSISESPEARNRRSGLTRVSVSLVGMTRDQDLNYNDPVDAAAPRHRKFELKGDVTPRNMGFTGVRDLNADVTPPTKPATPTLTPGHCKGLIVGWATNPSVEGVTLYKINWGPSSTAISGSRSVPGPPFFLDRLTHDTSYFVSIHAQDAEGNVSPRSDPAQATTANLNTPGPPTGLTTSTDQAYKVAVTWSPVTANTASDPAADPEAPRIRDLAGYRLYSTSSGLPFPPLADARLDADETTIGTSFQPPFNNSPVVACQNRYYVMTAVDTCGLQSAPTAAVRGRAANPGVRPKPPTGVRARFEGAPSARITWNRISADLNDQAIRIDRYQVFRSSPVDGGLSPTAAEWDPTPLAEVNDRDDYTDTSVPNLAAGQVLYYRVSGADDCGNTSEMSAEARLGCAFAGDAEIVSPTSRTVTGHVPVTVTVRSPRGVYVGVTIIYADSSGVTVGTYESSMRGISWTDNAWMAGLPNGDYTITATVTDDAGCSETEVMEVTLTLAGGP